MAVPFRHLRLQRPLCALDAETTGTCPRRDRIIEVAVVRYAPDAGPEAFVRRVDPGVPIPTAATAVYGLGDADVAGCPPFADVAPELARFLGDADLAGFNILRFDLPLLLAEFRRSGLDLPLGDRRVVDVQRLYHRLEPRDLAAAARRYLGGDHKGAHGAEADARAAAAVLDRMLAAESGLPRTVPGLHAALVEADLGVRLRRDGDRLVLAFGRHAGRPLDEVAGDDAGYLRWLLGQDFLPDFRALVVAALVGAGD
jgi:DNA polymerase-3 subunit epsilon